MNLFTKVGNNKILIRLKSIRISGFEWVIFAITLILFYINAFHETYPDEFDNLLGGWYILHGVLPFSGFFSHHGPVAYFVSAFVQIFSGHSFVRFRVVYGIFLSLFIFLWYLYLKSRFGVIATKFYLYFSLLIGIAATYFWAHMLIADSLSGYLMGAIFVFFLLKYIYKEKINFRDIWIISIFNALTVLNTLTDIYLCAFIYFFLLLAYFQDYRNNLNLKKIVNLFIILAIPYVVFMIYLLLTGSLSDYIYQSIIFNEKYYIYNYPNLHNGHINPIRFAIVMAYNFYSNFYTLLVQVKNFNFPFPLNITLAVVDLSLLVYVFFRRNYSLFVFIIIFMIYSNARSNPLNSGETDYQSSVYIFMSLISLVYVLSALYNELHLQIALGKKIILSGLLSLCLIYSFFSIAMLTDRFLGKAYGKYMGTAPRIYDTYDPAVNINNAVSGPNDYIWMGPLDFQDYYYATGKLASKYHILIPGMGKSQRIQNSFISEISAHKPKVIFFQRGYFILGSDPTKYGSYFMNFLNSNYITLSQYQQGNIRYTSTIQNSKYSLDIDMFINKDDVNSVITTLLNDNFIKPMYATH